MSGDSLPRDPASQGRAGLGALCLAVLAGAAVAHAAPNPPDYELPPIRYSHTKSRDAVAQLLTRLAEGRTRLAGSDKDILLGVLRELNIPVESQVLVFSKTSAQRGLIDPGNPRALYFSDSVYIGYVPGGLIEAAAVDPELGPVFYAFDPQDARDARRTFVREKSCLRCHGDTFSREIPGLFEQSVATSAKGEPLLPDKESLVDDGTPFGKRWGGWYVTGYTGAQEHRGNAFATGKAGVVEFSPNPGRPQDLSGSIDTSKYLAPTSDIVALLVFQHQLDMHNSLTRAAQRYRRGLADSSEDVVDHLLFRNAAPLPAGIEGTKGFRRAFAADARRSAKGDSLRDLSLQGRLFANRCSFLIYSDSFQALPPTLKQRIFDGLDAALHDDDPRGRYAYLGKAEKRRILEVLSDTLPDARPHLRAAE